MPTPWIDPTAGLSPGWQLDTAFQPVFSLTHGRLVGHEALLRVTDGQGRPIAPNLFFDSLGSHRQRAALDVLAVRQHLGAYLAMGKQEAPEWLLLNLHPSSLLADSGSLEKIEAAIVGSGIRPSRIVIEVLESPLFDDEGFHPALQRLRSMGCLIALDDFGAGHSNFERVFQLSPHLVKLDRNALLRAKADPKARRILQRMVSLIQECGALVLIEGIETVIGAHIALTCDVDFVQGYYFGRPEAKTVDVADGCVPLEHAWQSFDEDQSRGDDRWRDAMGVHCDELKLASIRLAAGASMNSACEGFLSAPTASMCYLLDHQGRQIQELAFRDEQARQRLAHLEQFEPLHDCVGARWSRRQYFRRAMAFPGAVQLTRPYLTLQGGWMCFTASVAFELEGRRAILCGDLRITPTPEVA